MMLTQLKFSLLAALIAVAANAASAAPTAIVHVFASGENGIFANAYIVETSQHVVVIDTTLLESTSKALREKVTALKKPLRAVLLTHGHPDHYNGVTNVVAGETVDVISTAGADRVIRASDAAKEKQWVPMFGAEWPKKRTFPNRIFKDGEKLAVDGVTFTLHDLGAGESDADAYWLMNDAKTTTAFIGDVVIRGAHAYLTDGHSAKWLKNLDRVSADLKGVKAVYPGHGEAGGTEMLDEERHYLREYRETVRTLAKGQPSLTDAQKAELVTHMATIQPSNRLAFLVALGADPVAAELADEAKAK